MKTMTKLSALVLAVFLPQAVYANAIDDMIYSTCTLVATIDKESMQMVIAGKNRKQVEKHAKTRVDNMANRMIQQGANQDFANGVREIMHKLATQQGVNAVFKAHGHTVEALSSKADQTKVFKLLPDNIEKRSKENCLTQLGQN